MIFTQMTAPRYLNVSCPKSVFYQLRNNAPEILKYLEAKYGNSVFDYTHVTLKCEGGSYKNTLGLGVLRTAVAAESLQRHHSMIQTITRADDPVFLTSAFLDNATYGELIIRIIRDTEKAIVLSSKDTNQVIACSRRYCDITGKSLDEWQFVDKMNGRRWVSSCFDKLYTHLDSSGLGTVIKEYEYQATYCKKPQAPVNWNASFQSLSALSGLELRLTHVHAIDDRAIRDYPLVVA